MRVDKIWAYSTSKGIIEYEPTEKEMTFAEMCSLNSMLWNMCNDLDRRKHGEGSNNSVDKDGQ